MKDLMTIARWSLLALGLHAGAALAQTGPGAAGPRFVNLCMNGDERGKGGCPPDAARPAAAVQPAAPAPVVAPSPDGPTPVVRPTSLPVPAAQELACTRDRQTGLVWLLDDALGPWDDGAKRFAPSANEAARCGLRSGWRVPTRRELLGLVDLGRANPSIDTSGFPGARSDWYWTSDSYAASANAAWVVVFSSGATDLHVKVNNRRFRLVNGPLQPPASLRINGDGTVADGVSGLVWDRCEWGASGAACDGGTSTSLDWSAARAAVRSANEARHKGHADWRLPTRAELESLVSVTRANPALDPDAFPKSTAAPVWTDTPSAGAPASAWFVDFGGGGSAFLAQQYPARVRLVRGPVTRP